ncbi:N-acetylmuramoyl-L-alanine amidase [Thermus oshimai]|uniref:N-acetylmuramoyl-L-alanine amidase family protein n=1 Tax=Thermus oshimai TaxID=56957 RepID=UPI0031FB961F
MRFFPLFLWVLLALAQANLRVGIHEGFTRVVVDLPASGVGYALEREGALLVLRLSGLALPPSGGVVDSKELASYQAVPEGNGTRLLLRTKSPQTEAKLARYSDPERLVVDLYLPSGPTSPSGAKASPSGLTKPPRPPKPLVLLDPGHGGVDPGMVGYVVEKELVLDVALRLKRLLEREGIEVLLTRDRDMHLSPDKREDLSRRAGLADSSRVNLFISIHANATLTHTAQGIEVYYFGRAQSQAVLDQVIRENGGGDLGRRLTQEARTVAEKILQDIVAQANQRYSERLAETLGRKLSQATGSPYRGSFPGDFFVLRYAKVPAVLVEVGFGDHPVEGRKLQDPAYREKVAQGLLSGILTFLAQGAFR